MFKKCAPNATAQHLAQMFTCLHVDNVNTDVNSCKFAGTPHNLAIQIGQGGVPNRQRPSKFTVLFIHIVRSPSNRNPSSAEHFGQDLLF
mgnify:CR=1 FL=1